MYHDRYTRRRATDSFHGDEELPENTAQIQWSWLLMLGVILVQVTSRNIWASFGVISAFLFGDDGPSWLLLTTPTAFAVCWAITEPWVRRLTKKMDSTSEIMYIIAAGMAIAWLGAMSAAKSPIQSGFIISLVGSVGGFGSSIMAAGSITLLEKHFPTRLAFVRLFEEILTAMTFFIMPIISYFIMETFGDHGGILIHSGILMQGLIGAVLLRGAKWKTDDLMEQRSRAFSFQREDSASLFGSSESDSDSWTGKYGLQQAFPISTVKPISWTTKKSKKQRVAFGLKNVQHTPPQKRRFSNHVLLNLPSIAEDEEENLDQIEELETDNEIEDENSLNDVEEEIQEDNLLNEEMGERQEKILTEEENLVLIEDTQLSPPPPKPPRTFEHVFATDRVVVVVDPQSRNSPDYENVEPKRKNIDSKFQSLTSLVKVSFEKNASKAGNLFLRQVEKNWKQLTTSLAIPCAFLLFVTQNALLTFVALTPVMLNEYIDDGTNLDGAYCVSVMGLTWLCFVLSSPCFSTIHFSNHQVICVIALFTSSLMLYLVSQSASLDELVLFSCLFGLSHGVTRLTTYSILKINLGKEMVEDLSCLLYFISGVFHLLSLLTASLWDWGGHLKNLFALPCTTLALAGIFWTIHGFILSVRADRGRHDVTWSRRRRFS